MGVAGVTASVGKILVPLAVRGSVPRLPVFGNGKIHLNVSAAQ